MSEQINIQNKQEAIKKSVAKTDMINSTKTMYDVSSFEVFGKNLLAGMGRAIGSIIMYFVFLFIVLFIFMQFVYPQVKPYIDSYTNALKIFEKINPKSTIQPGIGGIDKQQLEQMLEQYSR